MDELVHQGAGQLRSSQWRLVRHLDSGAHRSFNMFKPTVIAALALVCTSFGASANLISQNVTFTFNDLGSNVLRLTVDNILNATGDWAPVQFFDAFDVRDVGSFSAATATYGAQSEVGQLGNQVNGSGAGCNAGGGDSACFDWTPN